MYFSLFIRFLFDKKTNLRKKINFFVEMNLSFKLKDILEVVELNFRNYYEEEYYLYSIMFHSVNLNLIITFIYIKGKNADEGHYFTIARETEKSNWVIFNDREAKNLEFNLSWQRFLR